ncbi:MAG: hypothetical protein JWO34_2649 [Arthrobacter sp.]|nr:hypothetical protein [Arthrobacter sp.]
MSRMDARMPPAGASASPAQGSFARPERLLPAGDGTVAQRQQLPQVVPGRISDRVHASTDSRPVIPLEMEQISKSVTGATQEVADKKEPRPG